MEIQLQEVSEDRFIINEIICVISFEIIVCDRHLLENYVAFDVKQKYRVKGASINDIILTVIP